MIKKLHAHHYKHHKHRNHQKHQDHHHLLRSPNALAENPIHNHYNPHINIIMIIMIMIMYNNHSK